MQSCKICGSKMCELSAKAMRGEKEIKDYEDFTLHEKW